MKSQYPFSLDDLKLPMPQHAGHERDIIVSMPIQQPRGDGFLFAKSSDVKSDLRPKLTTFKSNRFVHPNALELAATIACLTFFERVHCDDQRYGSPKLIENDNWNATYWTMIHLFETNRGFIMRLDESEQFQVFNNIEPMAAKKYVVSDLKMSMLTENCGKSYTTNDGELLLEYVNSI